MSELKERLEGAIYDLQNWMEDNPGDDPGDEIREIVDSATPIYVGDILQCAIDDINLAITVPENGPAFDGEYSATNIIAANIYEYLEQKLWDYYREHEDDYLEDELETEDEEA